MAKNNFISAKRRAELFRSKNDIIYKDYSNNRKKSYSRNLTKSFNIYKSFIISNDLLSLLPIYDNIFPSRNGENYLEHAEYIISTIYLLTVSKNQYKNGSISFKDFTPLKFMYIRDIIGQHICRKILDFLICHNFIECNGSFVRGKRSMGYRFGPKYLELKEKGELNFHLDKTSINPNRNKKKVEEKPQELHIRESLDKVTINKEKATNFVEKEHKSGNLTKDQAESYLFHIDAIYNKAHYQSRSKKCGRVFNLISNMPRDLRNCISLNGEDVYNVDVKSCQPLLLASLYPTNSNEGYRYKKLVESGGFYDHVAEFLKVKLDKISKDNIKKQLWNCIFGKIYCLDLRFENQMAQYFMLFFPELREIMLEVKKKLSKNEERAHAKLPILLQLMESTAIIDNVIAELAKDKIPTLTIHDSILCNERYVKRVKNLIIDTFKRLYNLTPSVCVEKC